MSAIEDAVEHFDALVHELNEKVGEMTEAPNMEIAAWVAFDLGSITGLLTQAVGKIVFAKTAELEGLK